MSDSKFPSVHRLDEILTEYLRAPEAGTVPNEDDLIARNPELADLLRDFFADRRLFENWENEGGAVATGR